jgi:hypothetical protein
MSSARPPCHERNELTSTTQHVHHSGPAASGLRAELLAKVEAHQQRVVADVEALKPLHTCEPLFLNEQKNARYPAISLKLFHEKSLPAWSLRRVRDSKASKSAAIGEHTR